VPSPRIKSPHTDPSWFDQLSSTALIREQQILPGPDNPSPLINVSPSTWWRWVRSGRVPAPRKLSTGVSAWQVAELRAYLDNPVGFKSLKGGV
jgi:hypothetical protein